MKRWMSLTCMLMLVITCMAKFEPNTKWPYIYENFLDGVVYSPDMQKSEGKLNIHLSGNVLHYVGKDGKVYKSDDNKISRVEIGQDVYLVVDHSLMQLVAQEGKNLLLKYMRAEFSRIQSDNGGAYGASLNSSSTNKLSSIELGGLNTPELGHLLQERSDGAEIPVSIVYYFIVDGKRIEANKNEVTKWCGEENKSEDWKTFLKANKLKWKNEASLKSILQYLSK